MSETDISLGGQPEMTHPRFRRLATRTTLAAVLALGLMACGDDDDDAETGSPSEAADDGGDTGGTDEQASGDGCAALVEFNSMASNLDTEEAPPEEVAAAGEELRALWDDVLTEVPDDAAASAEELSGVLDDLAAGDPEAFNADATFETYTQVLSATIGECGFETLSATAVDYGFEGLPETVPAGTVALELTNDSEGEEHEMVIFKKADGETRSVEEIMNDPASEEEGPGEFAGFTMAPPGETGAGLAELTAGDYMVVCFIPVGGAEDGPPHFSQGMFAEFSVE